jgi:hypothetical protein
MVAVCRSADSRGLTQEAAATGALGGGGVAFNDPATFEPMADRIDPPNHYERGACRHGLPRLAAALEAAILCNAIRPPSIEDGRGEIVGETGDLVHGSLRKVPTGPGGERGAS